MQELSPSAFERVRPLFHHIRDLRAAVFTVLEGNQAGRVWVDQVANPRSAVMISDFCYLTSTPDASDFQADTAKWLEDEVLNRQEYTPIFLLFQALGSGTANHITGLRSAALRDQKVRL